jgi:hypothetical protein
MSNQPIELPFAPEAQRGVEQPETSLAVRIGYGAPESKQDKLPGSGSDRQAPTRAVSLTEEQAGAPLLLDLAYKQFLSATDGGKKPMAKEDFARMAPVWEKALEANASIKPEQFASLEYQALSMYGSQIMCILAMEKSGKKNVQELVPADTEKVSKEELQKAMREGEAGWTAINAYLEKALQALKPEDQARFVGAENAFNDKMSQVQNQAAKVREEALKAAGGDADKEKSAQAVFEATVQSAFLPAFQTKLDLQRALSPDLARVLDVRTGFLNDPRGVFARQYVESQELIDSYKHVDLARIQYAQALALQLNPADANQAEVKDKATKLLNEAMKNPAAAQVLETTTDGRQLLQALNLQTPEMAKAAAKMQQEQERLFPELKLAGEAAQLSASNWQASSAKFKEAEASIDREIMVRGQGKDVAESLRRVNSIIDSMTMQMRGAFYEFKEGRRELPERPGQDAYQKDAEARIIRSIVNGNPEAVPPVPAMTQDRMLQALVGKEGPQVQKAMQRILTASELETVNAMALLAQKAQNVSLIRLQHAIKASEFGHRPAGDADPSVKAAGEAARQEAEAVIKEIAGVDPETFTKSPEVLGALYQIGRGEEIKIEDGSAAALAYSQAARETIKNTQTGIADWLAPGASLAANSVGVATTGHYASEVPVGGALFGGSKEATARLVEQQAMMILSNAQEAQRLRDQTVNDSHSQLRGLAGDVSGVGASFLSGYGVSRGIEYLAQDAPVSPWIKIPAVGITALTVGGLTNNAVSGHELLASRGFIRNTVAAGTTYAAIKGFEYMPTNRPLSASTLESYASRGVSVPAGTTSAELGEAAAAQMAQASGAGKLVQIAQAAPARLNPLNYTPVRLAAAAEGQSSWNVLSRLQWAGWGGDSTARLLAGGAMNIAEYNARVAASRTLSTFGIAYGFGALNRGAAIITGEHLDGKKYDTPGAVWSDMHDAGLSTGLTASLTLPIVGKTIVPGSWRAGVGTGVENLFARVPGVNAPAAASALGSASLIWARPVMDGASRWGEATIYDSVYKQGQKRADDLRAQAAEKLNLAPRK